MSGRTPKSEDANLPEMKKYYPHDLEICEEKMNGMFVNEDPHVPINEIIAEMKKLRREKVRIEKPYDFRDYPRCIKMTDGTVRRIFESDIPRYKKRITDAAFRKLYYYRYDYTKTTWGNPEMVSDMFPVKNNYDYDHYTSHYHDSEWYVRGSAGIHSRETTYTDPAQEGLLSPGRKAETLWQQDLKVETRKRRDDGRNVPGTSSTGTSSTRKRLQSPKIEADCEETFEGNKKRRYHRQ